MHATELNTERYRKRRNSCSTNQKVARVGRRLFGDAAELGLELHAEQREQRDEQGARVRLQVRQVARRELFEEAHFLLARCLDHKPTIACHKHAKWEERRHGSVNQQPESGIEEAKLRKEPHTKAASVQIRKAYES